MPCTFAHTGVHSSMAHGTLITELLDPQIADRLIYIRASCEHRVARIELGWWRSRRSNEQDSHGGWKYEHGGWMLMVIGVTHAVWLGCAQFELYGQSSHELRSIADTRWSWEDDHGNSWNLDPCDKFMAQNIGMLMVRTVSISIPKRNSRTVVHVTCVT